MYEAREDLQSGDVVYLKSGVIYQAEGASGKRPAEGMSVFFSGDINSDALHSTVGQFPEPMTSPGVTMLGKYSRTACYRTQRGTWIWEKGAGDGENPGFPPFITNYPSLAHLYRGGLTREEAMRTLLMDRVFASEEFLEPFAVNPLLEIREIQEFPVTVETGNVIYRDFITAYAESWGADSNPYEAIRKVQVEIMRQRCQLQEGLTDREIVSRFREIYGSPHQISVEHDVPFRNDIAYYVRNPVSLHYKVCPTRLERLAVDERSSSEKIDSALETQANNLQAIYTEVLSSMGISLDADFEFPNWRDIITDVQIAQDDVAEERTGIKPEHDPFYYTETNTITESAAKILAVNITGREDDYLSLKQIDGKEYIRRIYELLPKEQQIVVDNWMHNNIQGIAINQVNAFCAGIDLGASSQSKDSWGAKMSDIGSTQPHFFPDDEILAVQYLSDKLAIQQMSVMDTIISMSTFTGTSARELEWVGEFYREVQKYSKEQCRFVDLTEMFPAGFSDFRRYKKVLKLASELSAAHDDSVQISPLLQIMLLDFKISRELSEQASLQRITSSRWR